MAGFGAGVHQYLSQLLTLMYSKTTTLLAENMVLVSLLLSTRTSIKIGLDFFYISAIFCFSLSAITSTTVLFPRLSHHDAEGLIFWRSILAKGDPEKYNDSIQKMDKAAVEERYAKDNYHISRTIRYKDALFVDLLDLTTVDAQTTRRQDVVSHLVPQALEQGLGRLLWLQGEGQGDHLGQFKEPCGKAEAIRLQLGLHGSLRQQEAHSIMG